MKISSKGDYGIRALVDLAQQHGRGPVPSAAIAGRQHIPESLVGQVLADLRVSGFVRSVRGSQGGHELAREPESIRLDDVVQRLEGSVSPNACLDDPSVCEKVPSCGQRRMWQDVRAAVLAVLAGRTIADLAKEETAVGGRYSI